MQLVSLADAKAYLNITKTANDAFLEALIDSHSLFVQSYTGRSFTPNPALVQQASTTIAVPAVAGSGSIQVASAAGIVPPAYAQVSTVAGATDTVAVTAVNATTLTLAAPLDHPHITGDPVVIVADTNPVVTVTVPANYRRNIAIPDARTVTSVTLDGQALSSNGYQLIGGGGSGAATDLTLTPLGPVTQGWLPTLGQTLAITGRFGIWPVPPDIKDAVLLMVSRAYRERDAAYGDVIQMQDGGVVNYFRQMPLRARAILDSYRILGVA